ncbi:Photosystem II reaction center PsbP family protein [Euphorbia peplus]|nr:Photosystem II reaction center PsbP family protein [Euphorbia peplus]
MALSTYLSISSTGINASKNSFLVVPFSSTNIRRKQALSMTKRSLNLSILSVIIYGSLQNSMLGLAMEMEMEQLEKYIDSKEGFTLLKPSSYLMVDKAGATVLFEETNNKNNIGVVVNPVRLSNLAQFGTPHFVADKLIQAEKRKESTKDAELIEVRERSGHGGLQIYEFEYKIDSTRGGIKRIFSAAFVASNKLYLLNISHSDNPQTPLDIPTRTMLENVLHSFDIS